MTDDKVKTRTAYLMCHEGSDIGRDIYVGSTSMNLKSRFREHKRNCYHQKFFVGNKLCDRMCQVGVENWTTRPLLTLECTKDVIRSFERMWCNILRCDLNMRIPLLNDNGKNKERVARVVKRNIEEKKYFCEVCDKPFQSKWHLNQHRDTLKHQFTFLNSLD